MSKNKRQFCSIFFTTFDPKGISCSLTCVPSTPTCVHYTAPSATAFTEALSVTLACGGTNLADRQVYNGVFSLQVVIKYFVRTTQIG